MNIFENWTTYTIKKEDKSEQVMNANSEMLINFFEDDLDEGEIVNLVQEIPPLKEKEIQEVIYVGDDEIALILSDGHCLKIFWGNDTLTNPGLNKHDQPTVFSHATLPNGIQFVEMEKVIPLHAMHDHAQTGLGNSYDTSDDLEEDVTELLHWLRANRRQVFKRGLEHDDRVDVAFSNSPDSFAMSDRQKINFIEKYLELAQTMKEDIFHMLTPDNIGIVERNPDIFVFFNN